MGWWVRSKVVAAVTAGATQDITFSGLTETPKLAIFDAIRATVDGTPIAHVSISKGATDGVNQWAVGGGSQNGVSTTQSKRIGSSSRLLYFITSNANTVEGAASFNSWITTGDRGVRIDWDNLPDAARFFRVTVIGGSDVEVDVDSPNITAAENATQDVDCGFVPDFLGVVGDSAAFNGTVQDVLSYSVGYALNGASIKNRSFGIISSDGGSTQNMSQYYRNNRCLIAGQISSADVSRTAEVTDFLDTGVGDAVDGFEVTKRDGAFNFRFCYYAVKVTGFDVDLVDESTPTATGEQDFTGLSFKPQMVEGYGMRIVNTSTNTLQKGSISHLYFDATEESAMDITMEDGASTTVCESQYSSSAVIIREDDGTDLIIGGFVEFLSNGWTVNYTGVAASALRLIWLAVEEDTGGGISATVNQVTETSTAQAMSRLKEKEFSQITENDVAQAMTPERSYSVAQITETDLSQPMSVATEKVIGQVLEINAAQGMTISRALFLGQVLETDTAQAISSAKLKSIGQTVNLNIAQGMTHSRTREFAQVVETDLAQSITLAAAAMINQVVESDLAQSVLSAKSLEIGQVLQTDSAQPMTPSAAKTINVNQILEINLAQSMNVAPLTRLVAQITETDEARGLQSSSKTKVFNQVLNINLARPFSSVIKGKTISQVIETDLAQSMLIPTSVSVDQVQELDTALGMTIIGGQQSIIISSPGNPGTTSSLGGSGTKSRILGVGGTTSNPTQ